MTKDYYSIGIDTVEATCRSMVMRDLCIETHCFRVVEGEGEDPNTYVLYPSQARRDEAFIAFEEAFLTARCIYSPHKIEVPNIKEVEPYDDVQRE